MKTVDINLMTRAEFERVPHREHWDREVICDSLVILPAEPKNSWKSALAWIVSEFRPLNYDSWALRLVEDWLHDSGFRLLDFVAVKDNEPMCRLSGGSDVIHLDGIGGFGYRWLDRYGTVPTTTPPSGWNIDCLRTSGLLRIWPRGPMVCGMALSRFEIFLLPDDEERWRHVPALELSKDE